MRVTEWLGKALLAILLALAGALLVTARASNPSLYPPAPGAPTVTVEIIDHGWHAGLVVEVGDIRRFSDRDRPLLAAAAGRFAAFRSIEVGWGDETFYRFAPAISDLDVGMAFDALVNGGNPSVLHLVGLDGGALEAFPGDDGVELRLTEAGFSRLLDGLERTFAAGPNGAPVDLGPGLYGPSLFFRSNEPYTLLNVCNHWIAGLLAAAGVPASPLPSTFSAGLLAELRWRAGAI